MPLSPGEIVDDKYRVVRKVGEGGMGAVFEAADTRANRRVAIKVLLPALARDPEHVARFDREARVASLVKSPYLADVIGLGDLRTGERFIVMEYLEGESLEARLQTTGPMPIKDVLRIAFQILDGLAKVHEAGVVHRDLNPHNIYLATSRTGETAKIIDFGLAKIEGGGRAEPKLTRPGSVLGTPHFMSPEQARGQMHEVDLRTDLYAFGVVLYRAITGQLPFRANSYADLALQINFHTPPSPLDLVSGLDANFSAIVSKAMAREKSARYASAREMLAALGHWAGIPIVADIALDTTAPSGVIQIAPKVK
jgi:serine/threonine-protein kinase